MRVLRKKFHLKNSLDLYDIIKISNNVAIMPQKADGYSSFYSILLLIVIIKSRKKRTFLSFLTSDKPAYIENNIKRENINS